MLNANSLRQEEQAKAMKFHVGKTNTSQLTEETLKYLVLIECGDH